MRKRKKAIEYTGILTETDMKKQSARIGYAIMFAFMIILCIVAVFPIVWTFLSGFKEPAEYYSSTPSLLPKSFDIEKIYSAVEILKLDITVVNSLLIFIGEWFFEIFAGGVAGYTISRLKPKGSRALFMVLFWMMLMPNTLSLVPSFLLWIDFPLIHLNFQNTFIPFWAAGLCNYFNIILFKNFFDSIPNSLIEAAQIDGCSSMGIFTKIVMPLSKPIIATITIFVFQGCWNNFLGPYIYLKNPELATVALRLYQMTTDYTVPEQMLASFIAVIPTMILFMICSRQILNNSMSAGVKE